MQSAAGFSAGSIPTIGIYGYISRSFRTAALVAVLQATTRPFAPWSNSFRAHPKVLVMATPMTIHEEKFHVLMERYKEKAQILPLPCPGLMDFIERGDLDGEDLHKYLEDLLYSYRENQVDAAVLGCTHYPFARKQIQQVLGENVKIFDGGEGTAREMKRRLQEKDLLCGRQKRGQVVFENSLTDDRRSNYVRNC